jgi:hypothetical protein
MNILVDLIDEIKTFTKGETIDTFIPLLTFFLGYKLFSLTIGIILSVSSLLILFLLILIKNRQWKYTLTGLISTLFAIVFVLLTNDASSFFYMEIITSTLFLVLILISLIVKKPILIYISHLTRNWPIKWFFRKDIYPAYFEVTLFWLVFLSLRLLLLIYTQINATYETIFFTNIILGTPTTFIVLILSYIYGIIRLGNLKGPSVDEFMENKEPPYSGQKKGF